MLIQLLYLTILPSVLGHGKKVTLGGLFPDNPEEDLMQKTFELSINAVNKMRHTSEELSHVYFEPESMVVTDDIYGTSQSVCLLVEKGIAAIFGPQDEVTSVYVQSMCDTMDVPYIVGHWNTDLSRMKAINFYPHFEAMSMFFLQLVTEFKWESFTILYDSSSGLVRMKKLLQKWDPKGYPVTIRYLGEGPDYRATLKRVKYSGDHNIVLECTHEILEEVLTQSLQVGLLSDRHKIIITSMDLQMLDLNPFQHSGVNITGVRLVDPEDPDSIEIFDNYLYELGLEDLSKMHTEWALIFDAVQLFARAFKPFKEAVKVNVRSLACDGYDTWEHGASLANFIRNIEMKGLTGLIKFDTNGFRSDFKLDIVRLGNEGLKTIGTWNSTNSIEWFPDPPPPIDGDEDLANKTFIVLISLLDPFNMLTESSTMKTGNDRYEGFTIDIIHELSKLLHFNYTFVEQTDKNTGKYNPVTGKWNGMIGKIIDKTASFNNYKKTFIKVIFNYQEADLAITDLTITSDREKVIDFTHPFMHLGISILYKKPSKAAPSLFQFLAPLSNEVWVYLLAAHILATLLLYFIARINPNEWSNPYPCIEEPEALENQFSLTNSFWFCIGSFLQQGSDCAPIGTSTRMLATTWYFFCMIMTSSYTANLAAFLTVETIIRPIKSAEDLANWNGVIKYGAKRDGATYNFFKGSNYSTYAKMFKYMEDNAKDVLTDSNDEGAERVLKENYAFLMESSSIEYLAQRQCNLSQVGGLLDNKGFGIAMRKHFPYRNKLNTAVLHLQESGVLSELKKKWWNEKRGGGRCREDSGGTSAAAELSLDHVGGVFLVLVVGVGISCLYTIWEMMWVIGCTSYKEGIPFKEALTTELQFIIRCRGSTRRARRRKSSSNSTSKSEKDDSPPYGFVPAVITIAHEEDQT
ncbi:glutamate receptor ionotropic, kainate 2-like isoform X2 [Chelonus insularis]|uniref:glutamate receptor ionotropic, kainate 2-like isoform X2 n=1 Tax=Chelonus insularis TaxID=460826 RepID=UPI00158EDEE4|nr:glutamate receptor ionotropic, kainate 2-like isoform X2 [Chelonus insularis]